MRKMLRPHRLDKNELVSEIASRFCGLTFGHCNLWPNKGNPNKLVPTLDNK